MTRKVNDIAYEVYRKFADSQQGHVEENPICEICEINPSVRITRFGPIRAACWDCLGNELEEFEKYCEEESKYREEEE